MEEWELRGTYLKIGWYGYLIVNTSKDNNHNTFSIYDNIHVPETIKNGDEIIINNNNSIIMNVDFWSKYYFPEIINNQMYYDYNTMGAFNEIIQYIIKNLLTIELY